MSGTQALPGKRESIFMMDPLNLTIVGDDPQHAAYNPERLKTFAISETTLADYDEHGVLLPIIIRKEKQAPKLFTDGGHTFGRELPDGTWAVVFAGRGRVRHAVEKIKRGAKDFKVPVRIERGDDMFMRGVVLVENTHRRDSDPITLAREAFRYYVACGKNLSLTAEKCNVGEQAIRDWFSLLEASPKVLAAVQSGAIKSSPAVRLSKLARDEQEKGLAEMLATGNTSTASAEAQVKRSKAEAHNKANPTNPKPVPETNAPKKRLVREIAADYLPNTVQGNLLKDALLWALDGTRPPEVIRDALKQAKLDKRGVTSKTKQEASKS